MLGYFKIGKQNQQSFKGFFFSYVLVGMCHCLVYEKMWRKEYGEVKILEYLL